MFGSTLQNREVNYMKFQRIQDLRTDADMSQKQLSEILHISQRSYSHYETGSRNIPVEMLIRLAN
ncbi:MAG: helix-turn-helix transcriptional regulator, partial [Blautia wexlerae]